MFYWFSVTLWILSLSVSRQDWIHLVTLISIVVNSFVVYVLSRRYRAVEGKADFILFDFSVAFVLHLMFFALINLAGGKGSLFESALHATNVALALTSAYIARRRLIPRKVDQVTTVE